MIYQNGAACESPIEEDFEYHISKYLNEEFRLLKQVEVRTICGLFRMDFVIASPSGNRIAVECDGEEFHNGSRDEWRDAMILGADSVDAIIRIRGKDIYYHLNDVLYTILFWYPEIFSKRGRVNVKTLASDEAKAGNYVDSVLRTIVPYFENSQSEFNPLYISVERRTKIMINGRRQFWQTAFRFAQQAGGGSLDEVHALYRKK